MLYELNMTKLYYIGKLKKNYHSSLKQFKTRKQFFIQH